VDGAPVVTVAVDGAPVVTVADPGPPPPVPGARP